MGSSLSRRHWAGLGLLVLTGCMEGELELSAADEAEIASIEEAIDTPPACTWPEFLGILEPPRWKNIPTFLPSFEIHTCDKPGAETRNEALLRIQVSGKVSEYWLNHPGSDFQRNGTDVYHLPSIGSALSQMKDIQNITITKPGDDDWCFDKLTMKVGGNTVWHYNGNETASGTHLHSNGGNDEVWIRGSGNEAKVAFNSTEIKYRDRSRHGKLEVEIKTCTGGGINHGAPSDVRAIWKHDGLIETTTLPGIDGGVLTDILSGNFTPDRRIPGHVERDLVDHNVSIEKLDSFRLEARKGTAWCVESVRLLANGHQIFADHTRRQFAGDGNNWKGHEIAKNVTVETGTRVGQVGRHFDRTFYVGSTNAGFGAMPDQVRGYCAPPRVLTRQGLESLVSTVFAQKSRGEGYWGRGGVTVTRKSSNTVHVAMAFEADAAGRGNAKIWLDYDLTIRCGDPDPDNDDDTERAMLLVPSNQDTRWDLPLLSDIGGWFAESFSRFDVSKEVTKSIPPLETQVFRTANRCPNPSVDADANIHLDWDEHAQPNVLCRADSSSWARLSECARQLL